MQSIILNDVMLFLAVVDTRSFTAAAKQFNITKSVVSKRISRLEAQLGAQLLYRSTRKLSLSEVGKILFEHAQQIKSNLEAAELAVTVRNLEPRGTLRVNCSASFAQLHLVPALTQFLKMYPAINVELLPGVDYEDLVESGIDIAIRFGSLPDSSLVAKRLTVRPMRVCASPQYLEKHGVPQTPEELVQHNCLMHRNSPTGSEWHFRQGHRDWRIPVKGNFIASNSLALEAGAVSGLGIVMLPGYMLTPDIKKGNLVSLLEPYCQHQIGIQALFQQSQHMPPKVRAFIDFMYDLFQQEDYWS